MKAFVGKEVHIITNDGAHILGLLRGVDKVTNLILSDARERIYSPSEAVKINPLGLYLVRGDNCACVGTENPEVAATIDLQRVRAQPMKPVKH